MNTVFQIAGPFLGMGGGVFLAAGFIALLRLARGESIRPRPLRPLPYPTNPDRGWCDECTRVRSGWAYPDGSFTCDCGHHQPVSGELTVETPAPAPHAGAGAGTTQGD